MESKVKNYRSIKITVALIIAFILSICISNISNATVDTTIGDYDGPIKTLRYNRPGTGLSLAYWNDSTNMPTSTTDLTGMMPQYYERNLSGGIYTSIDSHAMRQVKLETSRYNLSTVEWKGTVENGVIYCAKLGGWIRYGHTDFGKRRFLTKGSISLGENGVNGTFTAPVYNVSESITDIVNDTIDDSDWEDVAYANALRYGFDNNTFSQSTPFPKIEISIGNGNASAYNNWITDKGNISWGVITRNIW